jgi:hypothetical protein
MLVLLQSATVRWSDWFEDGQGLGQIMAACTPVYDRAQTVETGVSIMYGVICVGIHQDTWNAYSDAAVTMQSIEAKDAECPAKSMSSDQMELIRSRFENGKSCKALDSKGGSAMVGIAIGGLLGLAVLAFAANKYIRSKRAAVKPSAPSPPSQSAPIVQGRVIAMPNQQMAGAGFQPNQQVRQGATIMPVAVAVPVHTAQAVYVQDSPRSLLCASGC